MANDSDTKTPGRAGKDRPTLTPITNNAGPMGIPLIAVMGQAPGAEKDDPPVLLEPAGMIHLPHGISFVPTDQWERAKKHLNVQRAMAQKIKGTKAPEWQGVKVGSKILIESAAVDAANPLAKLSQEEALDYLSEVVDPGTLGMLAELEKRAPVIRAIKEQKTTIEQKGVKALEGQPGRATLGSDD